MHADSDVGKNALVLSSEAGDPGSFGRSLSIKAMKKRFKDDWPTLMTMMLLIIQVCFYGNVDNRRDSERESKREGWSSIPRQRETGREGGRKRGLGHDYA